MMIDGEIITLAIWPLLTGWLLDMILGDPSWLPHPIVFFGKAISAGEHRLNHGRHRKAKGAFTAIGLIIATFSLAWVILWQLSHFFWVAFAVESILAFFCLAGKTLRNEVRMVFEAADRSLEEGRRQVGRIVGRDTADLSDNEVRTAALETLAENLSDGVVAPAFWYGLLGVPGMLAYKMVNTLDSMIGYRNSRYKDFGCVAARIDDGANYLPARITASLMAAVSGCRRAWRFVRKYGRCHASPNSGYPEAALAGILDCRFGGTHDYFGETVYKPYIGHNPRPLSSGDMQRAIAVNFRVEVCAIVIFSAIRASLLIILASL